MKSLLAMLSLACLLLCTLFMIPATQAQDTLPTLPEAQLPITLTPEVQGLVLSYLVPFAESHPWAAIIITLIGFMRVWGKLAFSALHALVDVTATKWDDGLWARIYTFFTDTRTGRFIAYLLDWIGSIKIVPPAKKGTQGTL